MTLIYTTWTNFYTVRKMNLLWWYFSGILRCGEKCTGPLERNPNLRKVTLRNDGLISSFENPFPPLLFSGAIYISRCWFFFVTGAILTVLLLEKLICRPCFSSFTGVLNTRYFNFSSVFQKRKDSSSH